MLKLLVSELKDGDALIVYALDRLGRRTVEVLQLIEELDRRKVTLISLREGVDYSTIAGRLVTQILVSLAEMERALISERTKAGLRAAREQGRMGGRPKSISQERIDRALQLVDGGMSTRKASKETGIHFTYIAELRRGRASE
jgi:DNA invertase Pin-like site-specific DNA recombinase